MRIVIASLQSAISEALVHKRPERQQAALESIQMCPRGIGRRPDLMSGAKGIDCSLDISVRLNGEASHFLLRAILVFNLSKAVRDLASEWLSQATRASGPRFPS